MQEVDVVLDKTSIEKAGYNFNGIDSGLYNTTGSGLLQKWVAQAKANYLNKVYEEFKDDADKLEAYREGLLEAGVLKNGVGDYTLYFAFSGQSYFMYFNNIELREGDSHIVDVPFNGELVEDESFFIETYVQATPTLYAGCLSREFEGLSNNVDTVQNHIRALFNANKNTSSASDYTASDVSYKFSFITPFRRLHSNASSITKENGAYKHTWNLTGDNLDKNIIFYRVGANATNWYLIAIGVAAGMIVIGCVTAGLVKVFKKKGKSYVERKD